MSQHVFFLVGLAFLLTHEMDAVRLHEWRLLPLMSRLNDHVGFHVFTGLHVPLYVLLFLLVSGVAGLETSTTIIMALDVFFIVHVGLHLLFLNHPQNEFRSLFSWSLVVAAAVAGGIDLAPLAIRPE